MPGDPSARARRAILAGFIAVATAGALRCSSPPRDPLQLEGNILTVDNRTAQDWSDVRIDLNTYYRITASKIRSGSRFQAPLDVFVAGFGQRFDFRRMQIHSLKLTATLPDGRPMELNKEFQLSGLAGALGGKR
jgi:hypothetical protein